MIIYNNIIIINICYLSLHGFVMPAYVVKCCSPVDHTTETLGNDSVGADVGK